MAASTTKIDEIRKRHKPTEWRGYEWCSVCSAPYPCDAATLTSHDQPVSTGDRGMSTVEDFRNAHVGATATHDNGSRAMKIDGIERCWILKEGVYFSDEQMEYWCWNLDPAPTVPKSAREALDLAWELAHEVKGGQVIPKGARYLTSSGSGVKEYTAQHDVRIRSGYVPVIRTLEPLPEPEPDWLDAPAVLAGFDGWDHDEREVFIPTGAPGRWARANADCTFPWSELRDVTPLYPKEGQQ